MSKEEKQRLNGPEQKHKKCIREKKRMKRQQDIEIILEEFKGVRKIPGSSHLEKELPMLLENSTKDSTRTEKEMTPNMK